MDKGQRTVTTGVILLIAIAAIIVGGNLYRLWEWLPTESRLRGCMITSMYEVDLCPTGKEYVKLSKISPYLQKALVASEDSRFWSHQGFDLEEIKNSIETNIEKKTFRRGGSTITQQLAKNMFLSKEKTITRKVLEAGITFQLERVLGKKEILERYLNVVQFGQGVFGVKKAAQLYFNKSASELNLLESAFLVMLLPNPQKYSRSFHQKRLTPYARKRMEQILYRMREGDRISQAELESGIGKISFFFLSESQQLELEKSSSNIGPESEAPSSDDAVFEEPDAPKNPENSSEPSTSFEEDEALESI